MTSQQTADDMHRGWRAARAGIPYQFTESPAWQRGWLDWMAAHD